MLTKIDKYILKNFLVTFFVCILAFTFIAIVIDLTEKIQDFITTKAPIGKILGYYLNFVPYIIGLLFPIFIFVAVILFTSRLATRSEIIAMLSSGMNFNRFLRPYIFGASIISVLLLFANNSILPNANKGRIAFEKVYVNYTRKENVSNVYKRISTNEYISIGSFNGDNNTGYQFFYSFLDSLKLKTYIKASRFEYDTAKNKWVLFEVVKRNNNGLKEKLENLPKLTMKIPITRKELLTGDESKQQMTTKELNKFIKIETARGSEGLSSYYIEKYRRTASPFSAFILSIIGACIASRKVRGGNGIHLALGLVISAAYILFMQFSTTFAVKGDLHPFIAVWLPNLFFSIVAFLIYKKFSK
ncbi:MAG: LptF/LptG family permease [Chitinophagaceae bacterium]|nr:LptF/LptG family permease [Chitinophagaceae bacterium]